MFRERIGAGESDSEIGWKVLEDCVEGSFLSKIVIARMNVGSSIGMDAMVLVIEIGGEDKRRWIQGRNFSVGWKVLP